MKPGNNMKDTWTKREEEIIETHKPLLLSIAYNMLGSVMDAEDCVQEAYLRWHAANQHGEGDAVRNPKAYLSKIVTNLSIDQLRSARMQREQYVGVWLPEPVQTSEMTDPIELAETLSIALLHLLEELSPVERAVFLLRKVFDYEYAEIAAIVQKSEENCRQIIHRAQRHLYADRPLYNASEEQQEAILYQFRKACENGDMDGLVNLLTEDIALNADSGGKTKAPLKMLASSPKIVRFLLAIFHGSSLLESTKLIRVNGQPAFAYYEQGVAMGVMTFDIVDGRIREIDLIVNPDKLQWVAAIH